MRRSTRWLIGHGVPDAAIVRDRLGATTEATAVNARAYMSKSGLTTALVATQYFHVARTRLALERQGVTVTGQVHARIVELRDAYSQAREVVGYAAYRLKR